MGVIMSKKNAGKPEPINAVLGAVRVFKEWQIAIIKSATLDSYAELTRGYKSK